MKCERCGNNATTHLHQNINGQISEVWLCSACAGKLGVGSMFTGFGGIGSLTGLLGSFLGNSTESARLPEKKRCSVCGSGFDDIARSGKLGCAECYEVFGDRLAPTIIKIHGSGTHTGKLPHMKAPAQSAAVPAEKAQQENSTENIAQTVAVLKSQLQNAVLKEEYEKAAVLRDKIKKLEEQL